MSAGMAWAAVENHVSPHAGGRAAGSAGVTSGAIRRPCLAARARQLISRLPRPAGPTTPTRIPGGRQ